MDLGPARDGRPTRVVFVCHANHCRSPMMELLLRAALTRSGPGAPAVLASSAGTYARPGLPAHPHVVRALAEHGVDATRWHATRLDVEAVEQADLVVTAAAEQRRHVVTMSPAAQGRTFALLDLAAWLAAAPAPPGPAVADLLQQAAAGRARTADGPDQRDLPDPMGRSLRHFRRCRRRIEEALVPILDALPGLSPAGPQA